MIVLPGHLFPSLRQRLGLNDNEGDALVSVEAMVIAMGDHVSLATLSIVMGMGDAEDMILLHSDGHIGIAPTEPGIRLAA